MSEPTRLYHARRMEEPEQLRLDPTKAPAQLRNGVLGQFLYATPRWAQAVLYAIPFPNSANSFITTLDGNDWRGALARFDSRPSEAARAMEFSNRIYSMDSEGFEPVKGNEREWIRPTGVAEIRTEAVVSSLDQALEAGVQYFTLRPGRGVDAMLPAMEAGLAGNCSRDMLAEDLASPKGALVWENERDGLGMDPELAAMVMAKRVARLESAQEIARPHGENALDASGALLRAPEPILPPPLEGLGVKGRLARRQAAMAEPASESHGPARPKGPGA